MPTNRDLKVNLIIGRRHVGKSHLINEFIKNIGPNRCVVFDPNEEHSTQCSRPDFETVHEFMDVLYEGAIVQKKWKNKPIYVFVEESTSYFRGKHKASEKDEALIMRNRHIGLEFYFIFHSLRSVPLWMIEYTDNFYLFKTGDKKTSVKQAWGEYPEIVDAYNKMYNLTREKAKGVFEHIEF